MILDPQLQLQLQLHRQSFGQQISIQHEHRNTVEYFTDIQIFEYHRRSDL